ncbi:hypothetical protein A3G67_00135 [Candidatus Roizmanbacteria bacterium RIFCSPLOWO2_12_FULL_40_12]|uniref:AI-2E family transporter n=1 Tax=Candidatus Roizmanbacteria bacterium RIFCSPLOWO2_01_FULL_40_42 TaxID=1802066 RepID=A0A1F7J5V9_9BACT|nr:MAG: hypothetical protein A2779_04885 [Candidatus Roizmanbacteria bacterium RIFCSPHIGHO2_01_FULL_40_98]OGK27796.1 MAG: hypothetical protein A3C31_04310 [Candidatus Roizmanbacteria bacterium RIFCSPHIGHO2_02_FULL_40_53]OGK30143.1 MAG: hypothetical protein A2W49_01345 [Candidatus Roizmanbacteria bacterium RIFCSPHIGHO2_12_41_18]OGK50993.1 MAG: hypothetical protein A3B50_03510 [Candidatus Roizmanbacteria bacterium RIFCSPLOWO2_01_FULL_40_42]OGK58541.1 MAG: hypothetical protein A3H84_00075 [Candida
MPQKVFKIEISAKTILFTIAVLLLLQLVWLVKELFFSFLIALIIMSALNPLVTFLEKYKIPRGLSAFIVFVLLITGMVALLNWILPPLIEETGHLFASLPTYIKTLNKTFNLDLQSDLISRTLPNITSNTLNFAKEIFSNVIFIISTIFFSFYFLVEQNVIRKFMLHFFDKQKAHEVSDIVDKAEKRMRAWFWGELTLMFVIGTLTFIGLNIIGVRYALPLAIIAGLLEIAPVIGPIISAIPAFIVGIGDTQYLGMAVVILYFIIQQFENQVIVPLVMKRAVGIAPIATLSALIIGGKIAGVIGILLAIPTALFLETIIVEIAKNRSVHEKTSN